MAWPVRTPEYIAAFNDTRTLRLVSSHFYGLATTVDSIAKAVVFVGLKNLRNMALYLRMVK